MNKRKISHATGILLLAVLIFSVLTSTTIAIPLICSRVAIEVGLNYGKPENPGKPGGQPSAATVDIRSPGDGEHLLRTKTVNMVAEVKGDFAMVKYKIGRKGAEYAMTQWGTSDRYIASWTITESEGTHKLYVTAYNAAGRKAGSASTSVNVVTGYEAEVWYEIDYLTGHGPTQTMLDYWVNYWDSRAIKAHPVLDDEITDAKYLELDITLFWEVENGYNDDLPAAPGDDRTYGNVNNGNPFLQEKWMFWGAYWYEASIGGFCYVWSIGNDGLAGNYIYINDGGLADWEATKGLTNAGGRVVALMHETGHSIGVIVYSGGAEAYDPDYYSVMSYIWSNYNAAFTNLWYYSREYWKTRNLGYY